MLVATRVGRGLPHCELTTAPCSRGQCRYREHGVEGIAEAVSGYTGGDKPDPTYEEVSAGRSGHVEAVQVRYNPETISYEELLDIFWRQIDPTDPGGQFADRGSQYQTYIYYRDDREKTLAEKTRAALGESGRFEGPVVTPVVPAETFYPAEEYHQDYHIKNPAHYKRYRHASGRTPFLEKIWGDNGHAKQSAKETYVKPNRIRTHQKAILDNGDCQDTGN